MSSKEIKVTDKRIFTADGELREGFKELEESPAAAPSVPQPTPEPTRAEPPAAAPGAQESQTAPGQGGGRHIEIPTGVPGLAGPSFFDLVAVVAEPVPIYLGEIALPDGRTAENLEMARLHIDLLEVLRQKSTGNLSAQELGFLEDLLYELRLRYVQKRG